MPLSLLQKYKNWLKNNSITKFTFIIVLKSESMFFIYLLN